MDKSTIQEALKAVKYPGFSRDIVSFGLIRGIDFEGGKATVALALTTADARIPTQLKAEVESVLSGLDGVAEAEVTVSVTAPKNPPPAAPGQKKQVSGPAQKSIGGVKHIIAVASGKGGVGKSTFSVNLACALDQVLGDQGKPNSVGIMDCDLYGPSVPLMIGAASRPEVRGESLVPVESFGVRVMSMGLLIDEDTPVVWRGPMIMKTIQQFAANVDWGQLEVLVVDLPPGTGDAQLSLVQTLPLDGALIVTTPQKAAVDVARRGAMMFGKVNVPLLGVVENMSYLENDNGDKQFIFGQGGGEAAAATLKTEFLGHVPLDPVLREGADRGIPVVVSHPERTSAQVFRSLAEHLLEKLSASDNK